MAVTMVILDIGANALVSLSSGSNAIPRISVRFEYMRNDRTAETKPCGVS